MELQIQGECVRLLRTLGPVLCYFQFQFKCMGKVNCGKYGCWRQREHRWHSEPISEEEVALGTESVRALKGRCLVLHDERKGCSR